MKRSPELKPNFWDGIVALAVIALAAAAALTVWQSRPESGALTAVVSANGQEIDRFVPADLENEPRTYAHNGYTLTVTAEGGGLRVAEADCPTLRTAFTRGPSPAAARASSASRPGL